MEGEQLSECCPPSLADAAWQTLDMSWLQDQLLISEWERESDRQTGREEWERVAGKEEKRKGYKEDGKEWKEKEKNERKRKRKKRKFKSKKKRKRMCKKIGG